MRVALLRQVVTVGALGLAQRHGIGTRMQGLGRLLQELARRGVLSEDEGAALGEMTVLLNEAVHGATVDPRAVEWAMDVGPLVLQALDEKG